MTEYRINLTQVRSWEDFVAAFNRGMIESLGGRWHGNSLDALDDYLSWNGFEPYRLVLVGWAHCEAVLSQIKWPGSAPLPDVIGDLLCDNKHVSIVYE